MVVESGDRADERQRLGLSIIALTLLVGALMARTLPMRRRQPWWGPGLANAGTYNAAYAGLYGYPMAYGEVSDLDARGNLQTTTSGAETRPAARTSETPALPKAKHSRGNRVEDVAASRRRRLRRASRARPTGTKRRVPRRVAAGRAAEYGRRLRRRDWLTSAKRLTRLSRASGDLSVASLRQKRGVAR
jgi:hypothetical protein